MGIVGSVTATTSSASATTVTLPTSNLTIVGIYSTGGVPYVKIPDTPSTQAIIPLTQSTGTGPVTPMRKVHFTVNGNVLNFTPGGSSSNTFTFYYGTPLPGSIPLKQFRAVVGQGTLSSGAGSATLSFPSGNLKFTGITVGDTTGAHSVTVSFATSTGQTVTLTWGSTNPQDFFDIVPLDLPTQLTVTVTLTGTSSDVINVYGFYQ